MPLLRLDLDERCNCILAAGGSWIFAAAQNVELLAVVWKRDDFPSVGILIKRMMDLFPVVVYTAALIRRPGRGLSPRVAG